jgi:tetratricopeptide (TPR) repeat protein
MNKALIALLIAPCIFAAEPDFSHLKVAPLPYPTATSNRDDLSFDGLSAIVEDFEAVIGRYPPELHSPEERTATYEKWSRAILAADSIRVEEGDTERILLLQARLFRQGHNMDVRECGQRAATVIEEGLRKYPESVPMNFQASYFYLQIDPKFAPEGEKALMRLRRLLGTDQNLEVERGLVFAYLYQNKVKQAKKQVDRCLRIAPDDKMLLQFREALKSGRIKKFSN